MEEHPPARPQVPEGVVSVADYERLAPQYMTPECWAYLDGGAGEEHCLRRNREAFAQWELVPHVLSGMRGADTSVSLGSVRLRHPLIVAPMAAHMLFHPGAEVATALGAAAMDVGLALSCRASVAIEEIPRHEGVPLWFQLYMRKDRAFMRALIARLEAAGCDGLMVTVDAPVNGLRDRQQRAGFHFPPEIPAPHMAGEPAWPEVGSVFDPLYQEELPGWEDLMWLKENTWLPVWLKGVLTAGDAVNARNLGLDGVVVSNHGGRVLDTLPTTLEVLPKIADAVSGHIPVVLDSGIRRGTDVFTALALGADAVMVGRPILCGLAVAGAVGVAHVLRMLRHELEVAMLVAGCRSVKDTRGMARRRMMRD